MDTTVAIVEDDLVLRTTLSQLINQTRGFRCVAACASGEDAVAAIPPLKPTVVIMDLNLPQMTGIECIRRLSDVLPLTPIMVLTVYEDGAHIFEALKAGACGYLLKRCEPEDVLTAITEAREGGAPMSSQIARRVVSSFREPAAPAGIAMLTDREGQLLSLLSKGFANKEIANEMAISVPTVRTHLRHIYEKLHVRSRAEAIIKVLRPPQS